MYLILAFLLCRPFGSNNEKFPIYQHSQFHIGRSVSSHYHTFDIGTSRYHYNKQKILRFGFDFGYQHLQRKNGVVSNQLIRIQQIEVGDSFFIATQYYNDRLIRVRPAIDIGYKIINKEKYTTDLTFAGGLGLNLFRKYEHHYFKVDTASHYTTGDLIVENKMNKSYSFFRRPDLFLGIRSAHFYKISESFSIWMDFLLAYNFTLSQNYKKEYYNGFAFQLRFGIGLLR